MSYENYAPPRSTVQAPADAGNANAPALWTPNTTANLCLLFPIALGAWLQKCNWEAMGRPTEARNSQRWMIADILFLAAWLVVPHVNPAAGAALMPLSFVMLIVWYYVSAKPQITHVKATYGKEYPRRSWAMPLAIGIAADVAITLVGRWL